MEEDFLKDYKDGRSPYRVPEGYFERKQKELKAIAHEPAKKRKPRVRRLVVAASAVAAAVIIGLFYWFQPAPQPAASELTSEEIEEYLYTEYAYGLSEEILIDELPATGLPEEALPEISGEEIDEFLDENYDQTLHYEYL